MFTEAIVNISVIIDELLSVFLYLQNDIMQHHARLVGLC